MLPVGYPAERDAQHGLLCWRIGDGDQAFERADVRRPVPVEAHGCVIVVESEAATGQPRPLNGRCGGQRPVFPESVTRNRIEEDFLLR